MGSPGLRYMGGRDSYYPRSRLDRMDGLTSTRRDPYTAYYPGRRRRPFGSRNDDWEDDEYDDLDDDDDNDDLLDDCFADEGYSMYGGSSLMDMDMGMDTGYGYDDFDNLSMGYGGPYGGFGGGGALGRYGGYDPYGGFGGGGYGGGYRGW